jgi:hypothetical protein
MDISAVRKRLAEAGGNREGVARSVAIAAAVNREKFGEKAQSWCTRWGRQFQREHGYDGLKLINQPGFNFKEAARQLRDKMGLREDVATSQVYALATGLVTQNLSNAYEVVPTVYREVAKILSSTRAEETYFPLQGANVPSPVEDDEALPTSSLGGNLTRIRNYKFGEILELSNTLEEDDQTGQVAEQASNLGDKMAYAEEQWWASQLITAYATGNIRQADGGSAGGIIPGACIAGSAPVGYGGPVTTAGIPTRDGIANLFTAADYITNVLGDLALFEVDCGVFANADKITVNTILKSDFNPNTPANTPNTVNGIFARNQLEDIFVAKFTRFFKFFAGQTLSGAGNPWFLGEAGKIGAFQDRTPLTVIMEVPNAGDSFNKSVRRTKCERRFGAGVVIPEATLRGN